MSLHDTLHPNLAAIVDAAFTEGFRVFVPSGANQHGEVGWLIYLCLDIEGPFACAEAFPLLDFVPMLTAPVVGPARFGSNILIDSEDTLDGQMAALREACTSPMVNARYAYRPELELPNRGKGVLLMPRSGYEGFTEITADGQEIPVATWAAALWPPPRSNRRARSNTIITERTTRHGY